MPRKTIVGGVVSLMLCTWLNSQAPTDYSSIFRWVINCSCSSSLKPFRSSSFSIPCRSISNIDRYMYDLECRFKQSCKTRCSFFISSKESQNWSFAVRSPSVNIAISRWFTSLKYRSLRNSIMSRYCFQSDSFGFPFTMVNSLDHFHGSVESSMP